jgi:hypothetical protein
VGWPQGNGARQGRIDGRHGMSGVMFRHERLRMSIPDCGKGSKRHDISFYVGAILRERQQPFWNNQQRGHQTPVGPAPDLPDTSTPAPAPLPRTETPATCKEDSEPASRSAANLRPCADATAHSRPLSAFLPIVRQLLQT